MPYIKDKRMRKLLNSRVARLRNVLTIYGIRGNLNYFLFKLAKDSCTNYREYADFLSELSESSAEIRRRLLAPHEDGKIVENGDVE